MSRKKSRNNSADPFAEREARSYERPIPSREFIMEQLETAGKPLTQDELQELLELEDENSQEALRRRLRAMVRDGQIIRNRRKGFALVEKLDLIRGRVIAHPDGFGFLVPEDGSKDLFIYPRQMRTVLHGDVILVRVAGIDRQNRREAAVVAVLERSNHKVVGRYHEENGISFIVPENKRITQDILVLPGGAMQASDGQIAVIEIVDQPTMHSQPTGHIVQVLGDHMAPGMEIDIAMRQYELPCEWPAAVVSESEQFGLSIPQDAIEGRVDLRETPLVTIDGADARDFDDAVFCEPNSKGWRLLVAIADVSHYVLPGSALDTEALERGNSVYFPERVIPMLPEVLSNGLCSINPDVERLCMVCEMQVGKDGKVSSYKFMEAVMRSHARLIYDDVYDMLTGKAPELEKKHRAIMPHLHNLYDMYKAFRAARSERGSIDFDTTETRIVFGENRKIDRIIPVERNDAHKIIEECMIAANVCAARYLLKHKTPALYRIHETPDIEKLGELREFLAEFGLQLRGGDDPEPGDYAEVLSRLDDRPDKHLIQTVLLRSMKQARYSPDNIGHFGLAQEAYGHFTSPIRRYPDLLVHRAIRYLLRRKADEKFTYTNADMLGFGDHCSMTDRRADEATRDVVNWLKCEYMMDKVGEQFDGTISSVTSFGIFIELNDIFVEGLVHVTALANDYYHFDPVGHRLVGERSNQSYRLGDQVVIQVARVSLDDRKIDFELVGVSEHNTAAEPGQEGDVSYRKPRQKGKGRRRGGRDNPGKKTATSKKKKTDSKKTASKKKAGKKKTASKKKVSDKKSDQKKDSRKKIAKKKAVSKPAETESVTKKKTVKKKRTVRGMLKKLLPKKKTTKK